MATQTSFSDAAGQNGADTGVDGVDIDDLDGDASSTSPLGFGVTLLTTLMNRPLLVLGVLAAALGAAVGIWLANRAPRRSSLAERASDSAEQASDLASAAAGWTTRRARKVRERAEDLGSKASDRAPSVSGVGDQIKAGVALAPLAMRLLSNPLVQAYLRRMVVRQVSSRFGR